MRPQSRHPRHASAPVALEMIDSERISSVFLPNAPTWVSARRHGRRERVSFAKLKPGHRGLFRSAAVARYLSGRSGVGTALTPEGTIVFGGRV